jgi:PAS domain S-box-containing protein
LKSPDTDELARSLDALGIQAPLLVGLIAHAPAPLAVYARDGRHLFGNFACRNLFGHEPPAAYDLRNDSILDGVGLLPEIEKVFAGQTVTLPIVWYDPRELAGLDIAEGRRVAIVATLFPLLDGHGEVAYVAASFRDETDAVLARERAAAESTQRERLRVEAEYAAAELHSSREQLRLILENAPVGVAYLDHDHRHVFVSRRYAARLGFEPERLHGATLREVWGDAVAGAVAPELERALAGHSREFELELPEPSGRNVYVRCAHAPDVDEHGRVRGVVVVLTDLTEIRRDQIELRENRLHLESSQRIAHVGSWELDLRGWKAGDERDMRCSDECFRIFGLEPGEVHPSMGIFAGLIHPDDRDRVLEAVRGAIEDGVPYSVEYRSRRRDGSEGIVHTRAERAGVAEGLPRLIGTTQDVTEIAQARREIESLNEKLEARVAERTSQLATANRDLEFFIHSVSHDLHTPLRSIAGFTGLLASEHRASLAGEAGEYLRRITDATRRMEALIDDLLELSRVGQAALHVQSVNTGALVREVLDELLATTPEGAVEVVVGNLPHCQADSTLLRQVFVNLIANAVKFSRDRRPARVEVACESDAGVDTWSVHDNGIGFSMQRCEEMFDVFRRLHPDDGYEGSGVGLSIVRRIVELHGGAVWAEAVPDAGATFRFTLGRTQSSRSRMLTGT